MQLQRGAEDELWMALLRIGTLEIDISNGKTNAEQSEAEGRMTADRFRQFYGDWEAEQKVWSWWAAPKYEKGDPTAYFEKVVSALRAEGVTEIRPHHTA